MDSSANQRNIDQKCIELHFWLCLRFILFMDTSESIASELHFCYKFDDLSCFMRMRDAETANSNSKSIATAVALICVYF